MYKFCAGFVTSSITVELRVEYVYGSRVQPKLVSRAGVDYFFRGIRIHFTGNTDIVLFSYVCKCAWGENEVGWGGGEGCSAIQPVTYTWLCVCVGKGGGLLGADAHMRSTQCIAKHNMESGGMT